MLGARGGRLAVVVTAFTVALAGCGERTMSAGEFADAVRAQGVQLRLGDELSSEGSDKKLYGFSLKPLAGAGLSTDPDAAHPGGTIAVYEGTGGAADGLEQCRSASLVCYQAGNIVVILEENGIEAQQLAVAIRKLGED
jgi:hypothetical protein